MDDAQWSLPFQVWEVPNKTDLKKIYRFMTVVFSYNYHNFGHCPLSIVYLKHDFFRRLDSVSVFS
jgi:hypothetical protein